MTIVLTSESTQVLGAVAETIGDTFLKRRVCCITTAAVPYPERGWILDEQRELARLGAKISELELSTITESRARDILFDAESIFVHGGNTFFLLQEMQRVGFSNLVREHLSRGGHYIGSSAGSIVVGPRIDVISSTDDPSKAPLVDPKRGLDLINFVPLVHFDNSSYWSAFEISFKEALQTGTSIMPIRNDQFVIVDEGKFQLLSTK